MLIAALLASNTGLQAASAFLNVVSNNVANSGTTGYKTQQVTFQDLVYTELQSSAGPTAGATPPDTSQLGAGVTVDAVSGLFTQGGLVQTGVPLDVAIDGDGFFAVTLPDGTIGYTRAGNFTTDATGQLVTTEGFRLVGGIVLPPGTTAVSISPDGVVSATTADGVQQVGTLTLTRFRNPGGLVRVGNTTFAAGPNSGPPTTGAPGANGAGTLNQGFLEQSNVDLVTELVNLLIAQRTFAFNSQAIRVESETLASTADLIA